MEHRNTILCQINLKNLFGVYNETFGESAGSYQYYYLVMLISYNIYVIYMKIIFICPFSIFFLKALKH